MLQSVQVRNDLGVLTANLPVGMPQSPQSYFIKNIDGLGPTDANIAMSSFANYDGGVFHSARSNNRNIVLTIGYAPDYKANQSVSELRKAMYRIFPPKSKLDFRFLDSETETLRTNGYVERVEPAMFTKDPQILISILCEDAYLSSLSNIVLNSNTQSNLNLSNYGDADTGFIAILKPTVNFNSILIRNQLDPDISFSKTFMSGDEIRISTVPGSKYAVLYRGSEVTRILGSLVNSTLQMSINERVTLFSIRTGSSTVPYSLTFLPKWQGV